MYQIMKFCFAKTTKGQLHKNKARMRLRLRRLHVRNFNILLKLLAFIKDLISQRLAER